MIRQALRLAFLCATRPAAAAEACSRRQTLRPALALYAIWVAASTLFVALKPPGFPDPAAAFEPPRGALFWLRALLWQPVLAALLVGMTGVSLRWMRGGWIAFKLAAGGAWTVIPFLVAFQYHRAALSPWPASLILGAWLAATAWYAVRLSADEWSRTACVLLGLNGISLLALAAEALLIISPSLTAYKALMVAALLWILAAAAAAFRRLEGVSTARALAAVFFALIAQNLLVGTAFLLHWLPLEVLKVLLYV